VKTPIFLRVYRDGKLEGIRQFTDEQIVIGSNDDVQLSLKGEGVFPLHAVIEERDTGHYLVDLGSQLGTFRAGQKIFDEQLHSGDELQVGPFRIEFFVGVPKPTQAPRGQMPTSAPEKPTPEKPVAPTPPISTVAPPPAPPTSSKSKPPPPVPGDTPASVKTEAPKSKFKVVAEPPIATTSKSATSSSSEPRKDDVKTEALTKRLRNSRGPVVEVVVAWRDIVVDTHHFKDAGEVTIGADEKATISVPLLGSARKQMTLLKIGTGARVCLTADMTGDYYRDDEHLSLADLKRKNRVTQVGSEFEIELAQGEMLRLGLAGDVISIYVRYSQETPTPIVGPLFDLTTSEATAVLTSAVVAAIFGLYMLIYSPKSLEDEQKIEQPARIATVTFDRPKKKIEVVEEKPQPQTRKIIKVPDHAEQTTTKQDSGKAAAIKPNPTPKKNQQISSTTKQGGTINTGAKAAGIKTEKPKNIKEQGLLGVFGTHGTQKQLNKAADGAGELLGEANEKTGATGANEERAGDVGSRLKNVGGSGKGTSTYGVAGGVGTQGKGTGTYGGGTGGIGKKGSVDLNVGESEAEFTGSIDKEAIRRVIRENKNQLQHCYDAALRRNNDVYGKIELHWQIIERGRAIQVGVKSNTVGDSEMGKCLARVIGGLTFPEPPPDTAADVVFPFVFSLQ